MAAGRNPSAAGITVPYPNEGDLIERRAIIAGICRYCAGFGEVPGSDFEHTGVMIRCLQCDGSGDQFGCLLADAYRRGRADQLALQRDVQACLTLAVEQGEQAVKVAA